MLSFNVYLNTDLVITCCDPIFIDTIVNNFLSHVDVEHELIIIQRYSDGGLQTHFTAKQWRYERLLFKSWNPTYVYIQ